MLTILIFVWTISLRLLLCLYTHYPLFSLPSPNIELRLIVNCLRTAFHLPAQSSRPAAWSVWLGLARFPSEQAKNLSHPCFPSDQPTKYLSYYRAPAPPRPVSAVVWAAGGCGMWLSVVDAGRLLRVGEENSRPCGLDRARWNQRTSGIQLRSLLLIPRPIFFLSLGLFGILF